MRGAEKQYVATAVPPRHPGERYLGLSDENPFLPTPQTGDLNGILRAGRSIFFSAGGITITPLSLGCHTSGIIAVEDIEIGWWMSKDWRMNGVQRPFLARHARG